jgi:hypothetical protein
VARVKAATHSRSMLSSAAPHALYPVTGTPSGTLTLAQLIPQRLVTDEQARQQHSHELVAVRRRQTRL